LNTGPTLDQIYRRALLVLWPRSQALANARQAGLGTLLSVLRLRLADAAAAAAAALQQNAAAGSAIDCEMASDMQQQLQQHWSLIFDTAAVAVVAALQACAEEAATASQQAQPSYPAPFSYMHSGSWLRSSRSSDENEAAAVLELGVQAVKLGIQGAIAPLLQQLLFVCSAKEGLSDSKTAAALAAAAVLDASATGPTLQQLVSKEMQPQTSNCIALIKGMASRTELQQLLASAAVAAAPAAMVEHLISLALAVPGLPAVQQAAVEKVVTALQGDAAAGIAAKVAGLLAQLYEFPVLQQQLASAAVTALCAAGPMQHCSSIS
jgi:hypothetical protein